jgi:prepilin-type processing-associated H-X9-DG protein
VVVRQFGQIQQSEFNEHLFLRKAPAGWFIVPLAVKEFVGEPTEKAEPAQLRQLATLIIHPELVEADLAHGQEERCKVNLRTLANGVLELAQGKDGKLELHAGRMRAVLAPLVKNDPAFRCPSDLITGKEGSSYSFNAHLDGTSLDDLQEPKQVVLLYEGANQTLSFRHGGSALVAFADGRVVKVDAAAAKRLVWKP